jgi:D-erythronate 2-dehydrogenase
MRLAVTGAGGFIGRRVVELALAHAGVSDVTATDWTLPEPRLDERLRAIEGDIADPALQAAALDGADAVIHLAAVLGGAAESDPAASRRVNLDATLDLMQRAAGRRFVLASTIAVYGRTPSLVNDDTPCAPTMVYAMHKRMAEIALETATRRVEIDGLAPRIPGVVARPGSGQGLKSAFLSELFHAMREARQVTLPVAPEGRTWVASVEAVACALLHAALLPRGLRGSRVSFPLPCLAPRFSELEDALRLQFPAALPAAYEPDPDVMSGFGMFGELDAAEGRRLGFTADEDLPALVARAVVDSATSPASD